MLGPRFVQSVVYANQTWLALTAAATENKKTSLLPRFWHCYWVGSAHITFILGGPFWASFTYCSAGPSSPL